MGASATQPPQDEPGLSILALLNVVLRHRRVVFIPPLILLVWMLGSWALESRDDVERFTAITTFDVEGGGPPQPAAGLAGQLGLVAPTRPSSAPYSRLLRTRALLMPVTEMEFRVRTPDGERQGTIADLYSVTGRTPAHRRERTVRLVRSFLSDNSAPDGTPALQVTTLWPDLSVRLADTLVVRLNEFNTRRQQSRVSQERRFTEARLQEKQQELRTVEARMQQFLLANRDFRNSPILTFEHDRLNRDVQLKQSLYTTLANQYELARIDEVRHSPVVSVIEPAYIPPQFDEPTRIQIPRKEIIQLVLALMLGVFLAFVVEFYLRTRAQSPEDVDEFHRLKREAARDLRRPWRLFLPRRKQPAG